MNIFVLKNTLIKVYIFHFLINIFIEKKVKIVFWRSCCCPKRLSLRVRREYLLTDGVVSNLIRSIGFVPNLSCKSRSIYSAELRFSGPIFGVICK